MASSEDPAQRKLSTEPLLELSQWQYDEYRHNMQQWKATYEAVAHNANPLPTILECFSQQPQAAFHFQCFAASIVKWQGRSVSEPFDGVNWVCQEEPKIVLRLRDLVSSMERDFQNGKFPIETCRMELKNLNRALFGSSASNSGSKQVLPNSLVNHMHAIAVYLEEQGSRWQEIYHDDYFNVYHAFQDATQSLNSLLLRQDQYDHSQDGTEYPQAPRDGRIRTEQSGIRRRKVNAPAEMLRSEPGEPQARKGSQDHTPVEAMLLLAKALNAAFHQIPFSAIRNALWEDERAPMSLSLVFTSMSSVLVGVAFVEYRRTGGPSTNEGFFTLLSDTLLQLFSLYLLLLPFLRGQEPHIRSVWFRLSIGSCAISSVLSCIVYPFSWLAAAILKFGGTLASTISAFLLVQGIDKGHAARGTENPVENAEDV